jgi:Cytochrome c554 and c-prime
MVAGLEPAALGRATIDLPTFRIAGPLPSRLTVRYSVAVGMREGDEHQGFSGRRHGLVTPGLAFFTGRQVFLVPQLPQVDQVVVRIRAPEGERIVCPWRATRDGWRPGVGSRHVFDDLLAGTVGVGSFDLRTVTLGRTRFEFAFPTGTALETERHALDLLVAAARFVRSRFEHDLGPTYRVLALGKSPEGDELIGDAWATGQGGTLLPLTPSRLAAYTAELIDVFLRDAPYRTTFLDPSEYWLVDGLRELYAWRAVAAAGLLSRAEVDERLALRHASLVDVNPTPRDLETIYDDPTVWPGERAVFASFALDRLDRSLQSASNGRGDLDRVVRSFMSRGDGSLYRVLARFPSISWTAFREDVIRGRGASTPGEISKLEATRTTPSEPGGNVVRRGGSSRSLTFVYTGATEGYLENCGCKGTQSGGLARRVSLIRRLREQRPDMVLLDAGSTFSRTDKQPTLDTLSREELRFSLRAMEKMGYDAVAVGSTELIYGLPVFRSLTAGSRVPWVCSSVEEAAGPIASRMRSLERGGIRLVVLGLVEPSRGLDEDARFEDATAALRLGDVVDRARSIVPGLATHADLIVAMGKLSPPTIRRLVTACPDLDVIVSFDDQLPRPDADGRTTDRSGFLGRTLILYTDQNRYGVNLATLKVGEDGRIGAAALTGIPLDERVPEDLPTRRELTRLYERIGRLDAAQGAVVSPFAWDSLRSAGGYVGVATCAGCHRGEFAQWRDTPHATAFKTLLDVHRHYQPRCVSCHVVGFGAPDGYRMAGADERLANVQCEVCHGPGARHAREPRAANIRRSVPEAVCVSCHTPEHSDHFVYQERLPRVLHASPSSPSVPAGTVFTFGPSGIESRTTRGLLRR